MSCVTPADLGKPIAAIVERCGAPSAVASFGTSNLLGYAAFGQTTMIWFDADQMLARILQFSTIIDFRSQLMGNWTVTLPFENGPHDVPLGEMTLAGAQSAFAAD